MKKPIQVETESAKHLGIGAQDQAAIEALAYNLWLARGCPIGSPEVDWFHAEEELKTGSLPVASEAA